jgi:hypothetical protein
MRKIFLIIIFIFAACPMTITREPTVIGSFEIVSDSGPLPPEYQWESKLLIYIKDQEKSLRVRYVKIDGCYGCADFVKEQVKINSEVVLNGDWYNDIKNLTDSLRLCDIGKKPKEITVGGGDKYISIKGKGLGNLIKWGKKPDSGEIIFRERNLCSKNKNWWGDFGLLQQEMVQAINFLSKKEKAVKYRFYHATSETTPERIEISVNPVTRTASVKGARVKSLDKEGVRKIKKLASDVNYYAEGEIKNEAKLRKAPTGLMFFDRGDGTFFSFKNGIQDPIGKEGASERLTKFYYWLFGIKLEDSLKIEGGD